MFAPMDSAGHYRDWPMATILLVRNIRHFKRRANFITASGVTCMVCRAENKLVFRANCWTRVTLSALIQTGNFRPCFIASPLRQKCPRKTQGEDEVCYSVQLQSFAKRNQLPKDRLRVRLRLRVREYQSPNFLVNHTHSHYLRADLDKFRVRLRV